MIATFDLELEGDGYVPWGQFYSEVLGAEPNHPDYYTIGGNGDSDRALIGENCRFSHTEDISKIHGDDIFMFMVKWVTWRMGPEWRVDDVAQMLLGYMDLLVRGHSLSPLVYALDYPNGTYD